jgi:carbon-monoxide dehydrogenase medium subunit
MYPDEFDLHEAASVEEALDLLAEHDDAETELLAGGHSLLPTMKSGLASPDVVIDIGQIAGMSGIHDGSDAVTVGANTTYATIADSDVVQEGTPVLAEAAHAVGDRQVRNMGTIGGNIAHADPASDLPGAVIAADATVVVQGREGERTVAADDFFQGMYATDVGDGELVTRVEVPKTGDAVGAYAKRPNPASGYAVVGVAAQLELEGGTVASASVGANGVMDHGVRLDPVEDALEGDSLDDDAIEVAAGSATADLDEMMMMEDNFASAEFRANLLEAYAERALQSAAESARAPSAAD